MFGRFRPNRNNTVTRHPTNDTEPSSAAAPRASTSDFNAVREKRSSDCDLEAQASDGWADPYGPAPGFKGWLKLYWHDLLAFVSPPPSRPPEIAFRLSD